MSTKKISTEEQIEKIFWWIIALVLGYIWISYLFNKGDSGRSSVGCFEEEPGVWICEDPA